MLSWDLMVGSQNSQIWCYLTLLLLLKKSETVSFWEDLELSWETATDTPLCIFSVSLGLGKDRSDPNKVISPVQGLTSQRRTHACRSPGRTLWILPSKQNSKREMGVVTFVIHSVSEVHLFALFCWTEEPQVHSVKLNLNISILYFHTD